MSFRSPRRSSAGVGTIRLSVTARRALLKDTHHICFGLSTPDNDSIEFLQRRQLRGRRYLLKHNRLHRLLNRRNEHLPLRLSAAYSLASNVEIFALAFDAGELLAELCAGDAGGSAAHEGI